MSICLNHPHLIPKPCCLGTQPGWGGVVLSRKDASRFYEWKLSKPKSHMTAREGGRGFWVSRPCFVCARHTGNTDILELVPAMGTYHLSRMMTGQFLLEVSVEWPVLCWKWDSRWFLENVLFNKRIQTHWGTLRRPGLFHATFGLSILPFVTDLCGMKIKNTYKT